eukprot:2782026-Rhodomonas_salina.1
MPMPEDQDGEGACSSHRTGRVRGSKSGWTVQRGAKALQALPGAVHRKIGEECRESVALADRGGGDVRSWERRDTGEEETERGSRTRMARGSERTRGRTRGSERRRRRNERRESG